MRLSEIAKRIDKSKNNEDCVDTTSFNNEFDYSFDYVEQERLKAYWIGNWYCTDTWVGYRMYFLDDEPVAVSTQEGRKSDERFEWFSKELAIKVRDYLLSLRNYEDDLNIEVCDFNDDIGDSYKIQFNEQMLRHHKAVLNGQPVEVLERIKETPDYGIDTRLKVKLPDGEVKEVEIKELDFQFNLADTQ